MSLGNKSAKCFLERRGHLFLTGNCQLLSKFQLMWLVGIICIAYVEKLGLAVEVEGKDVHLR